MFPVASVPSQGFSRATSKMGTYENFLTNAQAFIQVSEKAFSVMSNQILPTTMGANASFHASTYADITTGIPVTNYQPVFPSREFIGSQVTSVNIDSNGAVHPTTYNSITTGLKMYEFSLSINPPPIGNHLNTSA